MSSTFDFWYPWHPAKYKAKTIHLSLEQDAIYRRLIDYYMETRKPIPACINSLARIVGCSPDVIERNAPSILQAYFKQCDGFLVHQTCEEIIADQDRISTERRKKAQDAAKARWENKPKEQEDDATSIAQSNADAMLGNATGQDKTRQDKKESKDISTKTPKGDFDSFWNLYPRKEGKEGARGKYTKAIKSGVLHETIMHGVERYSQHIARHKIERKYVKQPTTWLNNGCWDDVYGAQDRPPQRPVQTVAPEDDDGENPFVRLRMKYRRENPALTWDEASQMATEELYGISATQKPKVENDGREQSANH
jgi:uncharacterized protein YdaU (DUF1376 family)